MYRKKTVSNPKSKNSTVAIVGAGPAGCICAKFLLDAGFDVSIFDGGKFLRTILPTGGGRCNLAHAEFDFKTLAKNYPRGEKFLYSIFSKFGTQDTLDFFKSVGVNTYTQDDNRIFPISNEAKEVQTKLLKSIKDATFINKKVLKIIPPSTASLPLPPKNGEVLPPYLKTFAREMRNNPTQQEFKLWQHLKGKQLGVKFRRQHPINNKYIADFASPEAKLIIEVDGSQHIDSEKDQFRTYKIEEYGYRVIRLFNNDIDNNIEGCVEYIKTQLCAPFTGGNAQRAKGVEYSITTEKNSYHFDTVIVAIGGHFGYGILPEDINIIPPTQALVGLITKENFKEISGVSLKNVRANNKKLKNLNGDILFTHKGISGPLIYKISSILAKENTPYTVSLKLVEDFNLQELLDKNPHKEIKNLLGQIVPKSFAQWLLESLKIEQDTPCHRINGQTRDKILNKLTDFEITIEGKVADGEVVTCGGVDLKEVESKTLECKKYPNLYFCGEVLDIDGFCGGFNLQNCWSTGFIVAESIINK